MNAKKICGGAGLCLFAALMIVSTPRACAEDADADANIKRTLQQKISFEFVDTPLTESIAFIRQLSKVNMVIDPKVIANNPPVINLRVTDMSMELALQWITKLAELEYVVKDGMVFISTTEAVKERMKAAAAEVKAKKGAGGEPTDGILRARFVTGDMIEADASMLKRFPHLSNDIMSLIFDPVKDEILALAAGRDIPMHIPIRTFMESIKKVAPEAKVNYDDNLKLVLITSENESDLHKINAIARALRKGGPMMDMGGKGQMQVHFGEKENFKERKEKDMKGEEAELKQMKKKEKFEPGQKAPDTAKDEF